MISILSRLGIGLEIACNATLTLKFPILDGSGAEARSLNRAPVRELRTRPATRSRFGGGTSSRSRAIRRQGGRIRRPAMLHVEVWLPFIPADVRAVHRSPRGCTHQLRLPTRA